MADYVEAAEEPGTDVTGEITLTGTVSGDAGTRFDQHWTLGMIMDMTFTEDGVAIHVDATIDDEHVSTSR